MNTPKRKTYLLPVYMMVFSVLISVAFHVPTIKNVITIGYSTKDPFGINLRTYFENILIEIGIVYMIVLAECVVYWKLREKNFRKDFAVGHAVGVALALVGLPVGFLIYQYFVDLSILPSDERERTIRIMNMLDSGLLKGFLVVAHICFALVLISVWKNRKNKHVGIVAGEKDILNEYTDR